jgi:hypothetical protein
MDDRHVEETAGCTVGKMTYLKIDITKQRTRLDCRQAATHLSSRNYAAIAPSGTFLPAVQDAQRLDALGCDLKRETTVKDMPEMPTRGFWLRPDRAISARRRARTDCGLR